MFATKTLLNAAERLVLGLLVIPVAFLALDALVRFFDGRETNTAVNFLRSGAQTFTPGLVTRTFTDAGPFQVAGLAMVAWGIIAAFAVFVFIALRKLNRRLQLDRYR
jgi:hypothetical protein